jgi:hypothetical protein
MNNPTFSMSSPNCCIYSVPDLDKKLDFSKFEKPLKQDLIRYKIIKLNEDF